MGKKKKKKNHHIRYTTRLNKTPHHQYSPPFFLSFCHHILQDAFSFSFLFLLLTLRPGLVGGYKGNKKKEEKKKDLLVINNELLYK